MQLGDDDDDTVTVYGSLRVRNDKNDIVFDIDPYTGNTFTEGSLTVSGPTAPCSPLASALNALSIPGHSTAAVSALKSSLLGATGGNGGLTTA